MKSDNSRPAWARFIERGRAAQRAADTIFEIEWQRQVEQVCWLCQWTFYHTRDSRKSNEGFPDLVAIRTRAGKTRLVVAELKREGENPTEAQTRWLELFAAAGAETFVWRPSDLALVSRVLR